MSCEHWPVGAPYQRVTVVTMRDQYGVYDPSIHEKIMPPEEVPGYLRESRRNPYATAFAGSVKKWRGLPRG